MFGILKRIMMKKALKEGKGFTGYVTETDSARLKAILQTAAAPGSTDTNDVEVSFRLLDECVLIDPPPQVDYAYLSGKVLSITCKGRRKPVFTFLTKHDGEQYVTRITVTN